MTYPSFVKIVEVGPRDGLQNEKVIIPTSAKIEFINLLSTSGLSVIETTSYVSPKWIPQLADHEEVFLNIDKKNDVNYPVLVPNLKGFKEALKSGVKEIAVFTTPSESFSKHNTNCTVEESLKRIQEITQLANVDKIKVRGYISCVLGCPYEGEISQKAVASLAEKLIELGCYEISLGDTIGIGTPIKAKSMLEHVLRKIPREHVSVHFHDTYGQALANILVALQLGIATIDCSTAGLGGCPYAKGAAGNVATEEVLFMLDGMGIQTHVKLSVILEAAEFILKYVNKTGSKVFQANCVKK